MAEELEAQRQDSTWNQSPGETREFRYDPSQAPTPEEVQALMQDTTSADAPAAEYGYAQEAIPADGYGYAQEAIPADGYGYAQESAPVAEYGYAQEAIPIGENEYAQELAPSASQVSAPDPIQVRTMVVRTGRLVCDVVIPDARFRYTTPRLSAFANGQYPDLPHHACVNGIGDTFGYVMEKTSVPHLLEHLTISEQVRSQSSGSNTFVGTTEWLDETAGLARIEVGFKDDLVALRAFNEATRFLNIAVLTCLA